MRKGTIWIILGVICLLGALSLTVYNLYDTQRASKAADEVLEKVIEEIAVPVPLPEKYIQREGDETLEIRYPDYVIDPTRDMPTIDVNGVSYCGILEIEVLDMKLPVTSRWDYDKLRIAPCRFRGTAYQSGFVICAHNYISHFGQLREIQVGDRIYFTDMDGNRFAYEVGEVDTLSPYAVKEMISNEWDLTLFTCTIGGASRVTVRCVRVEE